jgi:hypothetical protein
VQLNGSKLIGRNAIVSSGRAEPLSSSSRRASARQTAVPATTSPHLRGAHHHGLVSARSRSRARDAQAQHLSGAH